MSHFLLSCVLLFVVLALAPGVASATTPLFNETATLAAGDNPAMSGNAVAAAGNTVVVGDNAHNAVYIYERVDGSLREVAKLGPPSYERQGDPDFGYSVAISLDGQTLVVGSINAAGFGGIVVYKRPAAGWVTGQDADVTLFDSDLATVIRAPTREGKSVAVAPDGSWVAGVADVRCTRSDDCTPLPRGIITVYETAGALTGLGWGPTRPILRLFNDTVSGGSRSDSSRWRSAATRRCSPAAQTVATRAPCWPTPTWTARSPA